VSAAISLAWISGAKVVSKKWTIASGKSLERFGAVRHKNSFLLRLLMGLADEKRCVLLPRCLNRKGSWN
jgi:hypothetical protein